MIWRAQARTFTQLARVDGGSKRTRVSWKRAAIVTGLFLTGCAHDAVSSSSPATVATPAPSTLPARNVPLRLADERGPSRALFGDLGSGVSQPQCAKRCRFHVECGAGWCVRQLPMTAEGQSTEVTACRMSCQSNADCVAGQTCRSTPIGSTVVSVCTPGGTTP